MAEIASGKNAETLRKGAFLVVQGDEPRFVHFLEKGSLEILSAPKEFNGKDADTIIAYSRRVGTISGRSLVSGLSLVFSQPYTKSIRALEDSVVTKYPIREGGFRQMIDENLSLALGVLDNLVKRIDLSLTDAAKYMKLYQNLCKISDNIAIMASSIGDHKLPEGLLNHADELYGTFTEHGGELPLSFDGKFLVSDNSAALRKKYVFPGLPLESIADLKQCSFFKRLMGAGQEIVKSSMRSDPNIATYIFETASDNLIKILDRIENVHKEIDEQIAHLFGEEESWAMYLADGKGLDRWASTGKLSPDFLKNLLTVAMKINEFYEEISGEKIVENYSGLKRLHELYQSRKDSGGEAAPAQQRQAAIAPSIGKEYKNSIHQIFEFALFDKENQKILLQALKTFKEMKNPFNTEIDGRKVRRTITKAYWDLYKQAYIRSRSEGVAPLPVRQMIRFGFLDETLVEPQQLVELHELINRHIERTEIPIHLEEEFLMRVNTGQDIPSINEMGLTYEQHLKEEGKAPTPKDKKKAPDVDDGVKKTFYEIEQRVQRTVAVCSGSTATAFPVLTAMVVKTGLTNLYVSKRKLESVIKELRDVDYSVFYREASIDLGERRELIKQEVVPNFIILPAFGSKTMMWQDLEGINRKSRGRIVVPILFMGDLIKAMAHTFAVFRYELNRTITGAMWRDPVEGGITGIYLDYVQFFKKNPNLSIEAKEKIKEKFKSLRDDRSKFAYDYMLWVLFEKDGTPKLNNVVRDIFYKNIPFKKEVRTKLETMPAFAETAVRFKNVNTRTVEGYKRKFKKYLDDPGNMPEELKRFMDFLNT